MPVYTYKAVDKAGRDSKGLVEAESPVDARTRLRSDGLHAYSVGEMRRAGRRIVRDAELALLTNQLAMLLRSGAPLAEALEALSAQTTDRRLSSALADVGLRIKGGSSLAAALSAHPGFFDELFVEVVRAGEASGELAPVLAHLSRHLSRRGEVASRIASALTYPAVMLAVAAGVVIFLMSSVVPRMLEVVGEYTASLPWPTRLLVVTSGFFSQWWPALVVGLVVAWIALRRFARTPAFDALRFRLPLLGPLFVKAAVSRLCTTLSTLLSSGIPATDALGLAARASGSTLLSAELERVRQAVEEGKGIAEAMREGSFLPPAVVCAVGVGEESAELERVLLEIASAYELEVELASRRLTDLLTPTLIVVMGVIVGVIVAGVVLPLSDLSLIGGP